MRKTVLAYGEVLWDLLPSGPALGGAPFNFAYRMHSLGHQALMVSRVGRDDLGERVIQGAAQLGMDTRFIERDAQHRTGVVKVHVDTEGQPSYEIVPDVAYDFIEGSEALLAAAGRSACVCYGTLVQRAERSRRTLYELLKAAPDAMKLLDLNLRPHCHTPHSIHESLGAADVLRLNHDEAKYLAELSGFADGDPVALLERIRACWALSHCVMTLGARGSLAIDAAGQRVYVPGYRTEVVDTVGAGDAFSAAFADKLLAGADLADACRHANALGAMVASQRGATQPIGADELEAFIASDPPREVEPSLQDIAVM